MHLNPLIKIENLSDTECLVKLLIDRKSYKINRRLFLQLLDLVDGEISTHQIQKQLQEKFNAPEEVVEKFFNGLIQHKILVKNLDDYPIEQINYWKDHKWLNALIYHLESQNIECFDDGTAEGNDHKSYQPHEITAESIWKTYADKPNINLPSPNYSIFNELPFEEVLLRRNSFSPFKKGLIPLEAFSSIINAANQDLLNNRLNLEQSAKALYQSSYTALETYVFVFSIESLEPGLYHYQPMQNCLYLLEMGDFKEKVVELCIGQRRAAAGGCLFLITANPSRYMLRYKHERAYRNMLTNVAELAHQYVFYSTALSYSTFITPAIKDDYASQLLQLNGLEELPLYTVAIG